MMASVLFNIGCQGKMLIDKDRQLIQCSAHACLHFRDRLPYQ